MEIKPAIIAAHYCISFVDLLGQRAEYKGEGLIPQSESERTKFFDKIRKTIKPIYDLQRDASKYIEAALSYKGTLRKSLPVDQQEIYDKMREMKLNQQRWSDGLVFFINLIQESVKCPVKGMFHILGNTGILCFLGLCRKQPIRGAVDIAWGVELHPGELYGAAVANAYEFESKIAQYPRIIIGERVIDYLEACAQGPDSDMFSELNRSLAERCLGMIAIDFDGNYILDYLGQGFKESITKETHKNLFELALKFINEQIKHWHNNKNTKLSMRYNHLLAYFQSRKAVL